MPVAKRSILFVAFVYLVSCSLLVSANRVSKNPPSIHPERAASAEAYPYPSNLSGDITFVSNYLSYGTSNTNNLPALQGSITYTLPSQLYVSLWGSNIIIEGWKQSLELYPTIGWMGGSNAWEWYVFGAYDAYFFRPLGPNPSYFEFEGAITRHFSKVNLRVGMTGSPNYYDNSGKTIYPFIRLDIPLQNDYEIQTQLAHSFIENNARYGVPDYTAIRLGIIKAKFFGELDGAIYFYATTIPKSQCFPEGPGLPPIVNSCGPGAFITLGRSFG
jgi:uncharacterized protein (TIGR02001 family)